MIGRFVQEEFEKTWSYINKKKLVLGLSSTHTSTETLVTSEAPLASSRLFEAFDAPPVYVAFSRLIIPVTMTYGLGFKFL